MLVSSLVLACCESISSVMFGNKGIGTLRDEGVAGEKLALESTEELQELLLELLCEGRIGPPIGNRRGIYPSEGEFVRERPVDPGMSGVGGSCVWADPIVN